MPRFPIFSKKLLTLIAQANNRQSQVGKVPSVPGPQAARFVQRSEL
jgi:hypothetical protein